MLKSFINQLVVVLTALILVACGSNNKKPEVSIVQKAPSIQSSKSVPILNDAEKQLYVSALEDMKSKEFDLAEEKFKQLLASHENLAGAYVNLGLIERDRKNKAEAKQYFEKAISANPKNIHALIQLSNFAQAEGKFVDSEQFLLRAYEADKSNSAVSYNLGVLYELYLQDYDKAIDYYEQYVQLGQGDDIDTVKRWIKLLERK